MDRVEMTIIVNIAEEDVRDILLNEHAINKATKPVDTWKDDIERRRSHLCRWACPKCGTFLGFGNQHCIPCGQHINWEVN